MSAPTFVSTSPTVAAPSSIDVCRPSPSTFFVEDPSQMSRTASHRSTLYELSPYLQREQGSRASPMQSKYSFPSNELTTSACEAAVVRAWQQPPQTPVSHVHPHTLSSSFDTASCSPMTTSSSFAGSPYSASTAQYKPFLSPYSVQDATGTHLHTNSDVKHVAASVSKNEMMQDDLALSIVAPRNGANVKLSPSRNEWASDIRIHDSYDAGRHDYHGGQSFSLGPSLTMYASALSPDRVPGVRSHVTTEIILRSTNGNPALDVHYPSAPAPQVLAYALSDPHAPTSQLATNEGTARTSSDGRERVTAKQHAWNAFSPPRPSGPPDQAVRLPGALPYTPPSAESYASATLPSSKTPRRQDEKLRFPGDLYTPRWVRGEGIGREGWCSLCENGNWLHLKTSQYLYHVRSTHGVNSNTGRVYDPPLQLRICDDTFGSTYGLCGECGDWVPICTPRRKRAFTAWFKHAHQCHRMQHHHYHRTTSTSLTQNAALLHFHETQMTQSAGMFADSTAGSMTNLFQTYEQQQAPTHTVSSSASSSSSTLVSPTSNSLPASLLPTLSDSHESTSVTPVSATQQRYSWVNGPSWTSSVPTSLAAQPFGTNVFLRDNSSAFNTPNTLSTTGHRRSTSDGILQTK